MNINPDFSPPLLTNILSFVQHNNYIEKKTLMDGCHMKVLSNLTRNIFLYVIIYCVKKWVSLNQSYLYPTWILLTNGRTLPCSGLSIYLLFRPVVYNTLRGIISCSPFHIERFIAKFITVVSWNEVALNFDLYH
jgi:hypothetical protein